MKLVIRDLKKAEHFAYIFKCVPLISDHVNIVFALDKIYIQTMDSNKVCLFELMLHTNWFDEYNVNSNDNPRIGLNTAFFYSILKCRGKDQSLEISYKGDADKLSVVHNVSDNNYEKIFELPLINLNSEMLHIPAETEWEADFEMKSSTFHKISQELLSFGEEVYLKCTEDIFSMATEGDSGLYRVNVNIDDLTCYSIDEESIIKSVYNLRYFKIISAFSKLSNHMKFYASQTMPLKVTYYLGDEPTLIKTMNGETDDVSVAEFMYDDENDLDEINENVDNDEGKNYIRFYLAAIIKEDITNSV